MLGTGRALCESIKDEYADGDQWRSMAPRPMVQPPECHSAKLPSKLNAVSELLMERPYTNCAFDELIEKEADAVSDAQNVAPEASVAAISYSSASACDEKGKRHNPSVAFARDEAR